MTLNSLAAAVAHFTCLMQFRWYNNDHVRDATSNIIFIIFNLFDLHRRYTNDSGDIAMWN